MDEPENSVVPIVATDEELPLDDTILDDDELREAVDEVEWRTNVMRAGYVQVSKLYIEEITAMSARAPSASLILWTLVRLMNKQNAVMISQDALCKITKLSKPTVKRGVALLRDEQWMEVLKVGTANVYRVNAGVIWQDKLNGKWAAFNARLILDFEDQDEMTKKMGPIRTRHIPLVEADDLTAQPTKLTESKL